MSKVSSTLPMKRPKEASTSSYGSSVIDALFPEDQQQELLKRRKLAEVNPLDPKGPPPREGNRASNSR
jgi:hypothetical protein